MGSIVEKIEKAVRLIQVFYESANVDFVEVAYSGGKDSDVILELTRMSGVPYKAYYKNTTIDPPHTLQHVKEMGAEVLQPKHKFFDLVAQNGFPNRFRRFCCRELKEYKVLDKVIIGVRADESRKRAERYKEPTDCRIYEHNKRAEALYPILFWSIEDIEAFIREREGLYCTHYIMTKLDNFVLIGGSGVCAVLSRDIRRENYNLGSTLICLKPMRELGKSIWASIKQSTQMFMNGCVEIFYTLPRKSGSNLGLAFLRRKVLAETIFIKNG